MTQEPLKEEFPERDLANGTSPDQSAESGPSEARSADIAALNEKLAEAQKAAEQIKDQLLRKAAEFENYKRRTEGEYANLIRSANESLILSLLPVLDDLSRSLRSGKERPDFDVFCRGIELIQNKLTRTLEGEGLKAFESKGKPFDVQFHDALLLVPSPDVPPHTVVDEVEQGYMLNDRVLRHAKVIVSAEPKSAGPGESGGTEKETDA